MLLGEFGPYPLEITIKSKMVGFWKRLVQAKELKLSYLLYQSLIHSSNVKSKWLACIESILNHIGRPDIWYSQRNCSINPLSKYVKNMLSDTRGSFENMEHACVPSRKVETNSDTAGALFYTPFSIKYAPLFH